MTTSIAPTSATSLRTVTSVDVAREAKVARVTVSRVLNGVGPVSAVTRRRVHEAAERLGYRLHSAAKAMRAGRFNAVGLLALPRMVFGQLDLIKGVSRALEHRGQRCLFAEVDPSKLLESQGRHYPNLLVELAVDGLVVHVGRDVPELLVERVRRQGVPAVWINTPNHANAIMPQAFEAGEAAAHRLMENGHRRIALVRLQEHESHRYSMYGDIQRGYESAMMSAGLTPRMIDLQREIDDPTQASEALSVMLHGPERPTALMTDFHLITVRLVHAAAMLGVVLPRDLSLIGVHPYFPITSSDIHMAPWLNVHRFELSMIDVGSAAVDLLDQQLAGQSQAPVAAPFAYVVGRSVGAPCISG